MSSNMLPSSVLCTLSLVLYSMQFNKCHDIERKKTHSLIPAKGHQTIGRAQGLNEETERKTPPSRFIRERHVGKLGTVRKLEADTKECTGGLATSSRAGGGRNVLSQKGKCCATT